MSTVEHDSQAFIRYYRRIYFTLVVLLVISVSGPFLGIAWVTLITAFGIALVKANLVVQNFMQLRWEKRLIRWLLMATLVLMALFVAGVAPDVMKHEGQLWVNVAAMDAVERGIDAEHTEEAEPGASVGEEEPDAEGAAVSDPGEQPFDAAGQFNFACALCHGIAGDGNGLAGAALDPRPADFTDPAFWATRDDERIFNAIKRGAASVGGSPLMAPWGAAYDDDQIAALVEYVQSFRPR